MNRARIVLAFVVALVAAPAAHAVTEGPGDNCLVNFLGVGSKSAVMLSDKACLRRGGRTGHVKFYYTIVLCHRGID